MLLDTAEVGRISERLGALSNRHKLLASYIAVQAPDKEICSQMGYRAHEVEPAVRGLCTELHMTYLGPSTWRPYIRAAVLLVASPDPKPLPEPQKKHKVKREQWVEAAPFISLFVREAARVKEPKLAALYSQVPKLFAYMLSMCGKVEEAEEYVQEAVARAYADLGSFVPGSNLKSSMSAWLFTIGRNLFLTNRRKKRREVEDVDGIFASTLEALPSQLASVQLEEMRAALMQLSAEQRDAVLAVAIGNSYEDAAQTAGCLVGTIKSRVNRARNRLAELVGIDLAELGQDEAAA